MNRDFFAGLMRKTFSAVAFFTLSGAVISGLNGCTTRTFANREARLKERTVSGRVVPQIVGKWQRKQTGGRFAEYARYGDNAGNFETLEIFADGRARRETLSAAKIYDCPVEDTTMSEGAIIVESDSQLNITYDAGTLRHTENCAPEKNSTSATKPATADYQWKVSQSDDGTAELCLTNGETVCYRRVE